MQKKNGRFLYAPTDLIKFMESPLISWLDRYNLERPKEMKADNADPSLELLQKLGNRHEAAYLSDLKEKNIDVCVIKDADHDGSETLAALAAGRQIVYQAQLALDPFAGKADFLERTEGNSRLGDFHYTVLDTKLALKPKPYFVIQLCCYAEMLADIQGIRPARIGIILGDKTRRWFRTDDYFFYYKQLKERFLDGQAQFDPDSMPELVGSLHLGKWTEYVAELLEKQDHLCRVANIRASQIQKLKEHNIDTMTKLGTTGIARITKMQEKTLSTLKQQARLQLESVGLPQPKFEVLPPDPLRPRSGLSLLPPQSAADVCFDMEGYPHVAGGIEYLFGVTFEQDHQLQFRDWWAHNRHEERLAFESFIDWVHARWKADPGMHIYHYAQYEVSAMRRLMGRYGTREEEVDELLRHEVFVDLFAIVRHCLRVGEPGYSIKNIEHLYMGKRSGDVASATDSVVSYERWLEESDGADWNTSEILANIRSYNKDDCDSTWKLVAWLRQIQAAEKIVYVPKPPVESKENQDRDAASRLAGQLLVELAASPAPLTAEEQEKLRVKELLAYLLEFHWREMKPVFWKKYDLIGRSEEELTEDDDCLGGLKRTTSPAAPLDQSFVYEYSFDPDQETKLGKGAKCLCVPDGKRGVTIHDIDNIAGKIYFKIGKKGELLPEHFSLIPNEFVPPQPIPQRIFDVVQQFVTKGTLPPALSDFLFRKNPRILGLREGSNIIDIEAAKDADALTDMVASAVLRLNNSYLCIQGPPGSGKTSTAASIILRLIEAGKKIAITSNSHKAINNLLERVIVEAKKKFVPVKACKIQKDADDPIFTYDNVEFAASGNDFFLSTDDFDLVGGTAHALSCDGAKDQFDYLFVDEAGQVCVANLVAMSLCTKNIVIMGDQMQLSQPTQGHHPGESGASILDYLMLTNATISGDMGIFLGTSWRMHSLICQFISGTVYEDRLQSAPQNDRRNLEIHSQPAISQVISKTAGLLFVPVEHSGNTQGSDEECLKIKSIYDLLLRCQVRNSKGDLIELDENQILVVAPYNMQVRKLKLILPENARVGTVDRFQGQQAPVVIVSMCASDPENSPRGIDFLFSKNRLNVAISRAETLAIVVASPNLVQTNCSSIEQMAQLNMYCRLIEQARENEQALAPVATTAGA
jgi:predicted RecB family nuclease